MGFIPAVEVVCSAPMLGECPSETIVTGEVQSGVTGGGSPLRVLVAGALGVGIRGGGATIGVRGPTIGFRRVDPGGAW